MDTKFETNNWVEYVVGFRSPQGRFQIMRVLPPETGEPRYRVKGEREAFERVARQSELQRIQEM